MKRSGMRVGRASSSATAMQHGQLPRKYLVVEDSSCIMPEDSISLYLFLLSPVIVGRVMGVGVSAIAIQRLLGEFAVSTLSSFVASVSSGFHEACGNLGLSGSQRSRGPPAHVVCCNYLALWRF